MTTMTERTAPTTGERVAGVAAVAGPVLFLASTLLYLFLENGINNGVLGGTVGMWSCFAMAIAVPGMLRVLEPVAPRAAPRVAAVAAIGFVAGATFNIQAMYEAGTGVVLLDRLGDGVPPVALLAFLPWGWFAPLSLALTGWLLVRAGIRAPGVLLVACGVLFVAGRPTTIGPLVLASDLLMVAALAPLGIALTRGRFPSADRTRR